MVRLTIQRFHKRLREDGLSPVEKEWILEVAMYTWKFFLNLLMTVMVVQLSAGADKSLRLQQRLLEQVDTELQNAD